MFTPDQITQLILKVNLTFTAQLKLTEKKQCRNATPTLRSVTPRPPTPVPADSPLKFWAESFERVLEAGDRMVSFDRLASKDDEDIDTLRKKAITLKNEYRQCFMELTGDKTPDQANALYRTAQEQAGLIYKAAYNDPNRDAIDDAKALFIASFTTELNKLAPISRPLSTTTSSPWSNNSLALEEHDSDVEGIANTFNAITI